MFYLQQEITAIFVILIENYLRFKGTNLKHLKILQILHLKKIK